MKPRAVDTTLVIFSLLLDKTADAHQRPDILIFILVIECAGIFNRDNDTALRVSVTPHLIMMNAHESVVEVVEAVVHHGDVAYHYTPGAVDVDTTKGLNPETGKPIAIEGRVHPVFLRDVQDPIVSLEYTGWHGHCVDIFYYARRLLWASRGLRSRQRYREAETSSKQRAG